MNQQRNRNASQGVRASALSLEELLQEALKNYATPMQLYLTIDYYRMHKQIPSQEELLFLSLLALAPTSPNFVSLHELYTNDPAVAETYADMMRKRLELRGECNAPITLGEAFRLANAYLARAGKASEIPGVSATLCKAEDADGNAAWAQGSSMALSLRQAADPLFPGDVFVLMHRGGMSHRQYEDEIGAFLTLKSVSKSVKGYFTVPSEGLISMLLPHFEGVRYDLRAITPNGFSATPAQLIGKFSDYRVLAVARDHAVSLCRLAAERGFRPIQFATVIRGDQVEIAYSESESIFFDSAFLYQFLAAREATATLPSEEETDACEISLFPVGLECSPYLQSIAKMQRTSTKAGADFSTAFAKLERNPFRTALQATLAAILSTAAAGCAYTESRLAIGLRVPSLNNHAERIGAAIATVLGVYRAQCELGIPAAITSMETDNSLTSPTLDVFSVSPNQTCPSILQKAGSSVYCVSPAMTEEELPDFEALRQLLRELAEWNEKGLIQSTRVICNERITDATADMESPTETVYLTDPHALAGDRIPLAILLESEEALPYPKIGHVTKRSETERVDEILALPKLSQTLNRGSRYEFVVLAKKRDRDAFALTKILRSLGADCTLLHESAEEWQFAKALLGAQTVLLCGDVKIPTGEQAKFAQQVLRAAGGAIVQLGENPNLPDQVADLILPEGISMTVLKQIQSKTEEK